MSKEKEDIFKKGKKFFLLVSIIVLSCSIIYGGDITIVGDVGTDVAGNGSGVNGTGPFDQDPNNNTITIEETGSIAGDVFGSRNDTKPETDVTSNAVVVNTTRHITGSVYGGRSSGTSNATSNTVAISNGNIGGSVYGGYSEKGEAAGNVVEITGGTIGDSVYGGRSRGNATSNKVVIGSDENSVNITSNVYGGYSEKREATENEIEIAGSPMFSSTNTIIYGGYSNNGKESKRGNVLKIRAKGMEVFRDREF
jgi:hypothetical protein